MPSTAGTASSLAAGFGLRLGRRVGTEVLRVTAVTNSLSRTHACAAAMTVHDVSDAVDKLSDHRMELQYVREGVLASARMKESESE